MSEDITSQENAEYMSEQERSKCHAIIHSAAVAAAAIGGGLAQIPTSDAFLITPLQIGMVASLGNVFGKSLTDTAIKALLSSFTAAFVGRTISQSLTWLPIVGNIVNGSTAFAMTEAVGWAIANYFAKETAIEAEQARKEAEERLKAEEEENQRIIAQFEARKGVYSAYSLRTVFSQIGQTVVKLLKSLYSLPLLLCRGCVYVASSIWWAVRGFFVDWLWGLVSGKAVPVLKWTINGIWNLICGAFVNAFNTLITVALLSVVLFVLGEYQLLPPVAMQYFNQAINLFAH
ncbi:MAG: hypothetical protein IJU48_06770 [Synergistaceae bacterium]|nr:hypothetical protein [Synergistaceae bacterium]